MKGKPFFQAGFLPHEQHFEAVEPGVHLLDVGNPAQKNAAEAGLLLASNLSAADRQAAMIDLIGRMMRQQVVALRALPT